MTLLTMTIPDDPAELPRWLERRLMAPDFGRFIAELAAHFPATSADAQSRHLLDRWLPVALANGRSNGFSRRPPRHRAEQQPRKLRRRLCRPS